MALVGEQIEAARPDDVQGALASLEDTIRSVETVTREILDTLGLSRPEAENPCAQPIASGKASVRVDEVLSLRGKLMDVQSDLRQVYEQTSRL